MVFITGSSGYLGGHVLKQIYPRKGSKVKMLLRKQENARHIKQNYPKAEVLVGDLTDEEMLSKALKREKVVIHLAACLHGTAEEMQKANVGGLRNLISACKKNKVKKIIFLSSMAVKRPFPDDYAKTKIEGEKMIINSGIEYAIIRPTMIFGGSGGSFLEVIKKLDSLPLFIPIFGDGKYFMAPVNVDDVARAVVIASEEKAKQKGIYEISGERLSFNDFVMTIKRKYGIKKPVIHIPISFAKFLSSLLSFLNNPPITNKMIVNATTSTETDVKRFIKDFGFVPISFKEGVSNAL